MLINLYWILDAVQKGKQPDSQHVGDCFIAIRDELMKPDTEELVAHIYEALGQSRAAADLLTDQVIDRSRSKALPDGRLIEMLENIAMTHRMSADQSAAIAVQFGRLVEAAHGIKR